MTKTALGIKRNPDESWHDCAMRYAKKYGLEHEVEKEYQESIAAGESEESAAWCACYEWDICDLMEEDQ